MKLLFLDLDGVVTPYDGPKFSKYQMENLKYIIESTKAKVILSSDWRKSPINIARARSELLFYDIIIWDCTSILRSSRSKEIQNYIDNFNEITKVAILDDTEDARFEPNEKFKFFLINGETGLTLENSIKIVEFLNA